MTHLQNSRQDNIENLDKTDFRMVDQFLQYFAAEKVTCASFEATSPRPECLCSWFVKGVSPLTFIIKMVIKILKIMLLMLEMTVKMFMDN